MNVERGGMTRLRLGFIPHASSLAWSLPLDHDLEILPGHDERCGAGGIEPLQQCRDVLLERLPLGGVERGERLVGRSVEITEYLYPVGARAVAEIECLAHRADRRGLGAEELGDMRFGTPQRG